jgi:uncharacterized membrane protein YphA (DoxX/SURF4 family)
MPMTDDAKRSSPASWKVSKLALISRVLLGLLMISGGINNFLGRNPVPDPTPEGDWFLGALQETGYMLPAVAISEIGVGVLLLAGYFVPLALVVLAPVMVNIFLFHVFLQMAGVEAAIVAAVLYLHLVYVHRRSFSGVLAP